MDQRIREAIASYEDYQRRQKELPLEFVIECMTNPRRGLLSRFLGELLRKHMNDPSFFIVGIHYHELVEFGGFRKLGYSNSRLGDNQSQDPNWGLVHLDSKRKELEFYQAIGQRVLESDSKLPFLALVFTLVAPYVDYQIPIPSYGPLFESIQERKRAGMVEYGVPFLIGDVQQGIFLFRLGGDKCSGKQTALALAKDYISGREPPKGPDILDII